MRVTGSDYRLGIDLIRQSKTWCQIVDVFQVLMSRVSINTDKSHTALQIRESGLLGCERRWCVEIVEIHAVVALSARLIEVVPKAKIERQLLIDTPVVLHISRVVKALSRDVLPSLNQHIASRSSSEQE